jgi:hypothetical protein
MVVQELDNGNAAQTAYKVSKNDADQMQSSKTSKHDRDIIVMVVMHSTANNWHTRSKAWRKNKMNETVDIRATKKRRCDQTS